MPDTVTPTPTDAEERIGPFKAATWGKILDRVGTVTILLAVTVWLGYRVENFLVRVDSTIVEISRRHHEDASSVTQAINKLSESQIELRIAISQLRGSGAIRPTPNDRPNN